MIDLNKELKALKEKAKNLLKRGEIQDYFETLYDINKLQVKRSNFVLQPVSK